MHYHVLGLTESSTEDYMKNPIINWLSDKNKHPQDSAVMRMINFAKEVLEDLLRDNDAMREQEEDLYHQEEACREDE